MTKNNLSALLSLLKDPDEATFDDIVDSLKLDAEIIPELEKLWQNADNELAISRLDWLIGRARLNELAKKLIEWQAKEGTILEGAWLVATYQYPELTLDEIEEAIGSIAKDVWLELRNDMNIQQQVETLNSILFEKYGMQSDRQCRASINNMLLNNVLSNRLANHLGMFILYLSVAEKLDFPLTPVMLFRMLRVAYTPNRDGGIAFYIEPFEKGLLFDHATARLTITRQGVPFDRKYIQLCSNDFLIRGYLIEMMMLYQEKGMDSKVADIDELLIRLRDTEK